MKVGLTILLGVISFSAAADCACNRNRPPQDMSDSPYYLNDASRPLCKNGTTGENQNRNPNGESFGNYSASTTVGNSNSKVEFSVGGNN